MCFDVCVCVFGFVCWFGFLFGFVLFLVWTLGCCEHLAIVEGLTPSFSLANLVEGERLAGNLVSLVTSLGLFRCR